MKKLCVAAFLLLLAVSPLQASSEKVILEGWLSAYDKEPSEGTLAYRLEMGEIQLGFDTSFVLNPKSHDKQRSGLGESPLT